jgi:hypothetical protein
MKEWHGDDPISEQIAEFLNSVLSELAENGWRDDLTILCVGADGVLQDFGDSGDQKTMAYPANLFLIERGTGRVARVVLFAQGAVALDLDVSAPSFREHLS